MPWCVRRVLRHCGHAGHVPGVSADDDRLPRWPSRQSQAGSTHHGEEVGADEEVQEERTADMSDPAIKTTQLPHQAAEYLAHRDDRTRALLWEMGLGKSKELIDVLSHLFLTNKIDAAIVLAPNSVYANWTLEELPRHMAAPYVHLLHRSATSPKRAEQLRARLLAERIERSDIHWPDGDAQKPGVILRVLRILCMSYDALRTDRGLKLATDVSMLFRTAIVADESTAIKTGSTETAKRTKKVRARCHYAFIASGTPVAQSPFDIHSQVEFLDPEFWKRRGLKSISAFKSEFGQFELRRGGQRVWNELVGYRGLDRLHELIAPIASRLLKEDSSVKLPPKTYKVLTFDLTPAQRRAYDALRKEFLAELDDGGVVAAPLAVVRLTRLQQVACGFVTAERDLTGGDDVTDARGRYSDVPHHVGYVDRIEQEDRPFSEDDYAAALADIREPPTAEPPGLEPGGDWAEGVTPRQFERELVDLVPPAENPRLQLVVELVEQACHKVIVWCRFRRDVDNVMNALGNAMTMRADGTDVDPPDGTVSGIAVRYDGETSKAQRDAALAMFKDPASNARVFVANVHSISQGVTLTIAKTMVYYSNSHSPEKRLQSEDRFHRIGQDQPVLIVDLVARDTVDKKLLDTLRKKYEVAASVMGDHLRDWLVPEEDEER